MSKYVVYRADDNYQIKTNDVLFNDAGVWIYDDLETNNTNIHMFIPYCNIKQVVRYSEDEK